MNINGYIEKMKTVEEKILCFIDNDDNEEENYGNLVEYIKDQNILTNKNDFKILLRLINSISSYHFRRNNFFEKFERLLNSFKKEIKDNFQNMEILYIFGKNKRILLFLIKEDIIPLTNEIKKEINTNFQLSYSYLFYFKSLVENFEEQQRIGENEDEICALIRNDSLKEFITYVNRNNISLNKYINNSFFDTNFYPNSELTPSFIEYAAYFGSSKIFKYIYEKGVKFDSSLFYYAIHGGDAEIIQILEYNNIKPEAKKCIFKSVKYHNIDLFNYFKNNGMNDDFENVEKIDFKNNYYNNLIYKCFKYYNFSCLPKDITNEHILYYACSFDYVPIVEYLLKEKPIKVNKKFNKDELFNVTPIYNAAINNNQEILNILMNQTDFKVVNDCFYNCTKLTQISIPSSIKKIGKYAFANCYSLTELTIPSCVKRIRRNTFECCRNLKKISGLSSVEKVGKFAFNDCRSLIEISLPSATKIGNEAFAGCKSMIQIDLNNALSFIGCWAFKKCTSLKQISIPSNINEINKGTFSECTSLDQILIPPSVTLIDEWSFFLCEKLEKLTIPSSVTSIGKNAFYGCKSLENVLIQSSTISLDDESFPKSTKIVKT